MNRITRYSPQAYKEAINSLLERVATLETNLGALQVGDVSGATDGQQLTFDDASGLWIPGDANPA